MDRREDREGVFAERVTGEKVAYVGGPLPVIGVSKEGGVPPNDVSSREDMVGATYDSQGVSYGDEAKSRVSKDSCFRRITF